MDRAADRSANEDLVRPRLERAQLGSGQAGPDGRYRESLTALADGLERIAERLLADLERCRGRGGKPAPAVARRGARPANRRAAKLRAVRVRGDDSVAGTGSAP